jgi:hypothetical protein
MPPAFTTDIKVTVYSESTTMPAGTYLDLRLRAWTVPVFQGGALLDLDGNVLMDHRGIITGGFPIEDEARTVPLLVGGNVFNFPAGFAATSSYRYKRVGSQCKIKLSYGATAAAPASSQMSFALPYFARDNEVIPATYLDQGNRWYHGFVTTEPNSNIGYLHHSEAGNNGNVDESNPFVFGSGDVIVVSGWYEIAA